MRCALLLPALLCCATAAANDHTDRRLHSWLQRHDVSAYRDYLRSHDVRRLPPVGQLVASASDWKRCAASPFAIPPRAQWPHAAATYRLLDELAERGILRGYRVVSAYRDPELNACAGGSTRSAHAHHYAVDIVPERGGIDTAALCRFWKRDGRRWNMGLSRYPSGRIHIDVMRYRTWGADHTGASTFCS